MSAETAVIALLQDIRHDLGRLHARLDVLEAAGNPWPDRLTTSQAVIYARCSAKTLHRWMRSGRLSDLGTPRRWLRDELDRCLGGAPRGRVS